MLSAGSVRIRLVMSGSGCFPPAMTCACVCVLHPLGVKGGGRPDGVLRCPHTGGPTHCAGARLREPLPGEEVLLCHPVKAVPAPPPRSQRQAVPAEPFTTLESTGTSGSLEADATLRVVLAGSPEDLCQPSLGSSVALCVSFWILVLLY